MERRKLTFEMIVGINDGLGDEKRPEWEKEIFADMIKDLDIKPSQLSAMASDCINIEISAVKALVSLDMSALGSYADISGEGFMWNLYPEEKWFVEESDVSKEAFALYKIHSEEAGGFVHTDVKIKGAEIKKHSKILDFLDDDKYY